MKKNNITIELAVEDVHEALDQYEGSTALTDEEAAELLQYYVDEVHHKFFEKTMVDLADDFKTE